MQNPLLTVVVATKNEEKNIERLLNSLMKQSLPKKYWEVIMIDNGSTDKTRQIAKKFLKYVYNLSDIMNLKKIRNPRGAQVNFAVHKSHSDLIFFPDTDMTFDTRLLEEAVAIFKNKNVDALYVPEQIVRGGFLGKVRNFERGFYDETCIDAVRIVRKSLFLKVGGFDDKKIVFGPDDWDFTMMLKEKTDKFASTVNKIYHHEENLSLRKYISKKSNYTATFDDYIRKWGWRHPDIRRQFSPYYRYFGVFVENGKWKRMVRHPVLTAGMYALRILVGMTLIHHKFLR